MTTLNNWGPVAVIVLGYVLGAYFQNTRLNDLRNHVDKRFDDLYRYIDVRFAEIERRLMALEERLGVKP